MLFHMWLQLLLLDLHTDISGGRQDGLIFPSLDEFSRVCCDPHKGFSLANEAEVDVFLELSSFFFDPTDVGNLISGSSAFSNPACASGISQFMYC